MQYLLTEEEMEKVWRERRERERTPAPEVLAAIAKHMALQMIDLQPPNCGKPTGKPHGCIHVKDGPEPAPWYCSKCPAQLLCQLPKEWSK